MMPGHTHKDLTAIAVKWLRRANSAGGHGCQIALSECWAHHRGEQPDALGWRTSVHHGGTVLVEVKVSRADFLADAKKPHRRDPQSGIGRWRYYLCPEGLIQPDELPPAWGLLWVTSLRGVRALAGPAAALTYHSKDRYHEHAKYTAALQSYAQPRDVEREMAILSRLLERIPDVETLNGKLRELYNANNNLHRRLEEMRGDLSAMKMRAMAAEMQLQDRYQDASSVPPLSDTLPETG